LKEIGSQLSDKFDTRVTVELGKAKGKIVIEFADTEDLERITKLLG
jgi:ParB family chromosome partitioning protein